MSTCGRSHCCLRRGPQCPAHLCGHSAQWQALERRRASKVGVLGTQWPLTRRDSRWVVWTDSTKVLNIKQFITKRQSFCRRSYTVCDFSYSGWWNSPLLRMNLDSDDGDFILCGPTAVWRRGIKNYQAFKWYHFCISHALCGRLTLPFGSGQAAELPLPGLASTSRTCWEVKSGQRRALQAQAAVLLFTGRADSLEHIFSVRWREGVCDIGLFVGIEIKYAVWITECGAWHSKIVANMVMVSII